MSKFAHILRSLQLLNGNNVLYCQNTYGYSYGKSFIVLIEFEFCNIVAIVSTSEAHSYEKLLSGISYITLRLAFSRSEIPVEVSSV